MTLFGASYFGNRFPSHARSDLQRIAAVCDYVIHTINENDLIFHKAVMGKIFSPPSRGAPDWKCGSIPGDWAAFLGEKRRRISCSNIATRGKRCRTAAWSRARA